MQEGRNEKRCFYEWTGGYTFCRFLFKKKKIKNKKIKNWESRMKSASSLHTVTQANKTC